MNLCASVAKRRQSGVTLIEMLIVVTIIAVVGTVVFPSVASGLDNLRLQTTAERLGSTLRFARERAIREQTVCQVTVDPKRGTVEMEDLGAREGQSYTRKWDLPAGIDVNGDEARAFLFTPDGGAPRADIQLRNSRGRLAFIELDLLSAVPRVRVERNENDENTQ